MVWNYIFWGVFWVAVPVILCFVDLYIRNPSEYWRKKELRRLRQELEKSDKRREREERKRDKNRPLTPVFPRCAFQSMGMEKHRIR